MSDDKPRERKPEAQSFASGQEAVIYEVERACGELNKLKDLQLDEPFFACGGHGNTSAHEPLSSKLGGVNETLRLMTEKSKLVSKRPYQVEIDVRVEACRAASRQQSF